MAKIELGFSVQAVRAHMDKAEWEVVGPGLECRSVGLGSVFSLTPSGKVYTPFALGNLLPCPGCRGTGRTRCRVKRRVVKKWKSRNSKVRRLWVKRYGAVANWPAHIRAKSDHLNRLMDRADTGCRRCGSFGSHEAWDDECWDELARNELNSVNLGLETSEGDGSYLLAVEYRDAALSTDSTEGNDENELQEV